MRRAVSLRARLTAIILLPLIAIALLIGYLSVQDARERADTRFNRALLTAALAVSRDVAITGGDAISPKTNAVLRGTSGGRMFYHVVAPDGVFVTGYATPPVPVSETFTDAEGQQFFDGVHQRRSVRAVRFVDGMQIEGLNGNFTTTVWQDHRLLLALERELAARVLQTLGVLIVAVAMIVWFGVRTGLRPLLDLENAIAQRSSDELSPIQRAVPVEVGGVVQTLNRLFEQVSHSMSAQAEFISNAAHQLRNPIAGVLSLAEAVDKAPTPEDSRNRTQDLLEAARETADLSQKLLLYERAKSVSPSTAMQQFDLGSALNEWVAEAQIQQPRDVQITLTEHTKLSQFHGDPVMLREAMRNLIDNALSHGGPTLSQIKVAAHSDATSVSLSVSDDGIGLSEDQLQAAKERFVQLSETSGSGLGVSIVEAIARRHGGSLTLTPLNPGLCARIALPRVRI